MKPIYLVIQAFGPFGGRHVVDFRRMLDYGLFGIYGATGSGKSSIFNAMTFALFGEAVKEKVDNAALRSHHAKADLPTRVEFVFEIGGRHYRVVRAPDQERPAKRGGGMTKDVHKAWLFEVTAKAPETLDDQNPGSKIAEGKLWEVNAAIEGLLGYKAAQFRQIVLLPQGRFEAFLSADTGQRLQILRDLFDVSLYRDFTERIKLDAAEAEAKVRNERFACDQRLADGGFESMAALAAGIEKARETLALKKSELDGAKTCLADAFTALRTATEQDKSFQAYAAALTRMNELKLEADAFALKRERLEASRKAKALVAFDEQISIEQKAVADLTATLARTRQIRASAEANNKNTGQTHAALLARAAEFEQKRFYLRDLSQHRETLLSSKADSDDLAKANAALAEARTAMESRTEAARKASENVQTREKALDVERTKQMQRAELRAGIDRLTVAFSEAQRWEKKSKELNAALADRSRKERAFEKAAHNLEEAKRQWTEAEATLLRNHAALLAERLVEGEACLVCGSLHHPRLAERALENRGAAEVYEKARQTFLDAQSRFNTADVDRGTARNRHAQIAADLADLKQPSEASEALGEALQAAKTTLDKLGAERGLAVLDKALKQAQAAVIEVDAALETARQEQEHTQTVKAVAEQKLNQALSAIPPALRSLDALDSAMDGVRQEIEHYEAAVKAAEDAKRKAAEAFIKAERDATNAADNLERAQKKRLDAQSAFATACAEAGLSEEAYKTVKPSIPEIATLDADIKRYETDVAIASRNVSVAEEATRGLDRPDIKALKEAHALAEQHCVAADEAWHAARHQLDTRIKLQADIEASRHRLETIEAQSAPIRELSRTLDGKEGAKVNLETFAIGAMFDRVLDAANARMRPMTANRYRLVREVEAKGAGRKGLGLCIDDIYTGRTRPTATLSGGETFIAALALALGLSDVVESTNGSIRLDTIFIDEGFGSLDADNEAGTLDRVLTALHELAGQTRAVGVISHVPLVRQHIPNGFEIIPAPSGSTIEARL